ncbi:MAG: peptide transporter [Candidatus Latescibacteria bacterium]|nr:peptide transporter [Candidatus Latescibacterota bacterium]
MSTPAPRRETIHDDFLREEHPPIVPDDAPYEHGFSVKTVWAALFVGLIMLPGSIYLELVTGKSFAGAAEWVTIIMFIEISKRLFVRLKPQETIILYWLAGGLSASGGPFATMIWNQYLIQSPQADGLAQYIPGWVVPPRGAVALIDRTFLSPDWVRPVGLALVAAVLGLVSTLSIGYVLFRVTADVERLPFPMAPVQASGATALAESSSGTETWRWRVFTVGSMVGMAWGMIYVVVPTISGIILTKTQEIVPIPFADFTPRVRSVLPASPIGLGTDLASLLAGFVLPFWIVVGTFISSMLVTFIANPLLYHAGILHSWTPGMSTIPTDINNKVDFWLSFSSIGTSLVIGVIGLVSAVRALTAGRSGQSGNRLAPREPPPGRGDIRLPLPLGLWTLSTLCYIYLVYLLVPDFPWWLSALFGFLWTPFFSYIGARMVGITGSPYGSSFPYAREGSFYLSGYKGAAIWFAPVPMNDYSATVATFRQLELTKTKFGSLVRLSVLSLVLMVVFSFLFYSLIWKLAPIPSAAYPYVQKMWPLQATMQTLWVKSTIPGGANVLGQIIRWEYLGAGVATAAALYGVLTLLHAPSLLFYGLIGGIGAWPHYTILTFTGAMLGRYYFARRYGHRTWMGYAPVLLAGYGCGLGLIGMAAVSLVLIAKSTSQILF